MSCDTKTIEYRDIPQHIGYQAGSDGTIWSNRSAKSKDWANAQKRVQLIAGTVIVWRKLTPKILKKSHRSIVGLYPGPKWRKVHHLILEAFVGPRPDGMEACHDPDPYPQNNALSNLRWDTRQANLDDREKHGSNTKGVKNAGCKLTEHEVRKIHEVVTRQRIGRKRLPWGLLDSLAEEYGVNKETIGRIANGASWTHLFPTASNGPL